MASDPRDLVSVTDVLNWINTNTGIPRQEEQGVIQKCITGASVAWLHWTGRKTLNSIVPWNERYDGSGSDRLFLRNSPILKVFSVTVAGILVPPSTDGFTSPGWWIDDDRESISLIGSNWGPTIRPAGSYGATGTNYRVFNGWKFSQGRQTVAVSYLAGYNYQPAEVQQIQTNQVSVTNKSNFVIDLGVTYQTTGAELTAVASSPAQGQYTVAGGVYTFNAADNNAYVSIAYGYNGAPTDLQEAMCKFVHQNYSRRKHVDEKSQIIPGTGTAVYQGWAMDPTVQLVIENYKRRGLAVS